MKRIIHLSDLHFQDNWALENHNAWMIAHHIAETYVDDGVPTMSVVTGDCMDSPIEEYRQNFWTWLQFLRRFIEVHVLPGNHDYSLVGNVFDKSAVRPFLSIAGAIEYPHVVMLNSTALVLLDSADPEDTEWFADGIIGERQLGELDAILTQTKRDGQKVIVALHHHPYLTKAGQMLVDADKLMALLANRIDLLSFGHGHVSEGWREHKGIPVILASGKSTRPDDNSILSYRVILWDEKGVKGVYKEEIRGVKE